MMLKMKLLGALGAVMLMGCGMPDMPEEPAESPIATSRQGLFIQTTPPTPPIMTTYSWQRGHSLGLASSGAQAAYLVMYRDPDNTTRFLAFGYDPVGQQNLFVFSVALTDEYYFKNQWNYDIGQWKAVRGTAPSDEGTTDGIGGTQPPPRPQLNNMVWAMAFQHHSIQSQIEMEALRTP